MRYNSLIGFPDQVFDKGAVILGKLILVGKEQQLASIGFLQTFLKHFVDDVIVFREVLEYELKVVFYYLKFIKSPKAYLMYYTTCLLPV